jgi:hypothetical protein
MEESAELGSDLNLEQLVRVAFSSYMGNENIRKFSGNVCALMTIKKESP